MPCYELVFITRQDLVPNEVDNLVDTFGKILTDNGARIASKEYWGLRTLAYKIKKNSKGHYVLLNIEGPYEAVAEWERIMGYNEQVIRKAIFKLEALPTEHSELMVSVNAKDYNKNNKASN